MFLSVLFLDTKREHKRESEGRKGTANLLVHAIVKQAQAFEAIAVRHGLVILGAEGGPQGAIKALDGSAPLAVVVMLQPHVLEDSDHGLHLLAHLVHAQGLLIVLDGGVPHATRAEDVRQVAAGDQTRPRSTTGGKNNPKKKTREREREKQ